MNTFQNDDISQRVQHDNLPGEQRIGVEPNAHIEQSPATAPVIFPDRPSKQIDVASAAEHDRQVVEAAAHAVRQQLDVQAQPQSQGLEPEAKSYESATLAETAKHQRKIIRAIMESRQLNDYDKRKMQSLKN